jgi:hypothetical protein
MRHACILLVGISLAVACTGCATAPPRKDYAQFRQSDPKTILVVPAVNRSVEVNAPDYFLSTIVRPLAERGYYVFPVNVVKRVLEDDGLADANLVHNADPTRLGELFGADAILYVGIERWDAKYLVLTTQVTVEFTYVIKSGQTGEELWRTTERMVYQPQASSAGNPIAMLIVLAVEAAVTKAAPNYIPLTRQANWTAVTRPYQGLPAGPHSKAYRKDAEQF